MTHTCCLHCRLRFPPPAGAPLVACPVCGEPLQPSSPEALVGFRIFTLEDVPHPLPEAVAVSLPIPANRRGAPWRA
jgi:hypothetical protein